MKQPSKDAWIAALIFVLCCSVFLNILQDHQISKLAEQVENLEYVQSVMSDHIDDLERQGGADEYGE